MIYLQILLFNILITVSTTTDFLSLCAEWISISLSCSHDLTDLLQNSLPLLTLLPLPLYVWITTRIIQNIFWKILVIVTSFLSFKGKTHVYLLTLSITHNKNQIPLLLLLINYTYAITAPILLSINGKYPIHFSKFLIIGLCNSFANLWLSKTT